MKLGAQSAPEMRDAAAGPLLAGTCLLQNLSVFIGSFSPYSESSVLASATGVAAPCGWLPWHLLVPKLWNSGSKLQGTAPPYGELPRYPSGGFTVSHEAWHLPMEDFPSTAPHVACKQVLIHVYLRATPSTPESSFLVSAPFTTPPCRGLLYPQP